MKLVSSQFNRCLGLGNKLFSWARAKIYVAEHPEFRMLQTRFFSIHGGGITRGGIDYSHALRKIWLWDNFKRGKDEISRLEYFIKFRNLPKREFLLLKDVDLGKISDVGVHIQFKAVGEDAAGHDFTEFRGRSQFLLEAFEDICISKYVAMANSYAQEDFIGINVRCGNDFKSRKDEGGFQKTKLSWFRHALKLIRKRYGNLPAIIVSDGGEKQLSELLKERQVILLNSSSAVSDLLTLVKSKVLLASGNSSFSAWASFLGEMDTFTSIETPFFHGKGLEYGRNGKKIVELI